MRGSNSALAFAAASVSGPTSSQYIGNESSSPMTVLQTRKIPSASAAAAARADSPTEPGSYRLVLSSGQRGLAVILSSTSRPSSRSTVLANISGRPRSDDSPATLIRSPASIRSLVTPRIREPLTEPDSTYHSTVCPAGSITSTVNEVWGFRQRVDVTRPLDLDDIVGIEYARAAVVPRSGTERHKCRHTQEVRCHLRNDP